MTAYLDSSALIKRYVRERGSAVVHRLFESHSPLLVSSIALAESLAALARKRDDGSLREGGYRRARRAMTEEWRALSVVALSEEVQRVVAALLDRVAVRGMDAIQLASALWVRERVDPALRFFCSDRRLGDAAAREGLQVIDPERR